MIVQMNLKSLGKKTKLPITSTRLIIQCDNCFNRWETSWVYYKDNPYKKVYCMSCRNKLGISGMKKKAKYE